MIRNMAAHLVDNVIIRLGVTELGEWPHQIPFTGVCRVRFFGEDRDLRALLETARWPGQMHSPQYPRLRRPGSDQGNVLR